MSDLMLVRHHAHTGKLSMSETKHRFTGIGSLLETLYTATSRFSTMLKPKRNQKNSLGKKFAVVR